MSTPDDRLHSACCAVLSKCTPQAAARIHEALDAGANPRIDNNLPLRVACMNGLVDLVDRLLGAGLALADVRSRDNWAFQWACAFGHHAVVDRLLSTGLTVEDVRMFNNLALREACDGGHAEVVRLLYTRRGAPPRYQGLAPADALSAPAHSKSALDLARACRRHAVVSLLYSLGVPRPN